MKNVHQSNLQNPAVNQVVWRIRTPKLNLDLVTKSCKFSVNQVVWRIRIPKLNVDLVPRSCKNNQNQVVWRIRIRKVRFPKLILHCGLEAFVDIRLILFLKDQDPRIESRFSPKIMQIRCKPGGLEDKDPKTESGLTPKIMQKHSKPDSLKDQDPKSKISKINFALWIRGFCRHSSHPFFWRIRIRELNLDLVPRSCKYAVNQVVWRIRIPKLNLDLVPKSCKKQSRPGSLEDQDPKSKISKINFALWIRRFCRHLSHYSFCRIRIRTLNLDLVPRSCKYAANQVVWRIQIQKLNLDLVTRSCK